MLFSGGFFSPETVANLRVRAALSSAASRAGPVLRVGDLLAGALCEADANLLATLSQSLRSPCSLQEILSTLEVDAAPVGSSNGPPRQRAAFAPNALRALDEFASLWGDGSSFPDDVGIQVLAYCLFKNLDERERHALHLLDTHRALMQLKNQLMHVPEARIRSAKEDGPSPANFGGAADFERPFVLSPNVVPSEDLTFRVRTAAMPAELPFDDEPQYEQLFDAIARILHRGQAHHVFLVGERGVGKGTIIAELARRAAIGRIPFLQAKRFLRVDCRFIPPDESRPRLAAILQQLVAQRDLVVCFDGLAALLRTDRAINNKSVFLAALAHARFHAIGLLTEREYEEFFADDPEFAEFFCRADVAEPELEVAEKLMRHFALGLGLKYRVAIDEQAVRLSVVLSANYILNDQLPAKALKILQRVCEDIDYERAQTGNERDIVNCDDVVRVVAERSGVPSETLRGIAERSDYEQSLREVILGQDDAVREVATELGLIKAGMTDPTKPASVMLFVGQTGTGKTEMAKALARFYSTSKRLKTYTLGNCVEPHSVATIIGVPPGYVGNDQGGRLVNELNSDPYCVFLLDEADKAHPDVLQPFLNLFDEGWVCDQRGTRAYANKSIFILTTNVGQRMISEMYQQGKKPDEIAEKMKEALSQIRHSKSNRPVFTPEFLSRIKRIIVFRPLDRAAMEGITRKLLAELQNSWTVKRGKSLEIPEAAVRYICDQSHHLNEKSNGKEGGRIVHKLISDWLEAAVQRAVSEKPQEYKTAKSINIGVDSSNGDSTSAEELLAPKVTVTFCATN